MKRTVASVADIGALAPSFERHLRGGNRSARTIRTYGEAISQLDAYLANAGISQAVSSIKREHIEAVIEDHFSRFKASPVLVRFKRLQQFFRRLEDEGEIQVSPMVRMNPLKVQTTLPDFLKPEEVKALLTACAGNGFEPRRDAARRSSPSFYDTGLRLSELVNLKLRFPEVEGSDIDLDLDRQVVFVVGKGNRARAVPIGAAAVTAMDRYFASARRIPTPPVPVFVLSLSRGLACRRSSRIGTPAESRRPPWHSLSSPCGWWNTPAWDRGRRRFLDSQPDVRTMRDPRPWPTTVQDPAFGGVTQIVVDQQRSDRASDRS
ncbi:MAG: tyrosine-type recombinase/integrase [Actinobacteria bacterium]|nr:tyrosine-type recombinase/integrase [Actinomycetota bacterium]